MNDDFSVVTIVKGRIRQLSNLIASLEQSTVFPRQLIVVWMGPPCSESLLTSDKFQIIHKFVCGEALPIARARNRGFAACESETVVYIDVDCLVAPTLLQSLLTVAGPGNVITTSVAFLPTVPEKVDYPKLAKMASHPVAEIVEKEEAFIAFHTRLFAIQKADFNALNGFDEQFTGYGVSDADFAARCKAAGYTLHHVDDGVLHQFHPRFEPPVNHLFDIVNNAAPYKARWGAYPFSHYLEQFAEDGWINDDYSQSGPRIRRIPTEKDMKSYLISKLD